jgi:hypothetical protein
MTFYALVINIVTLLPFNMSKARIQAHDEHVALEGLLSPNATMHGTYVFGGQDCFSPEKIPEDVLADMFPAPRPKGNEDSGNKKVKAQYAPTAPAPSYSKG